MRLLVVAALLSLFLVGLPASTSSKRTPEQPERERRPSGDGRSQKEQADISRSGRDFLEVCSSVGLEKGVALEKDGEGSRDAARDFSNAHAWRDATCLGWVAGFAEGFLVHDELLGVPRRDRLA